MMTATQTEAVSNVTRLYYESTGVVFVKYKGDNGKDADYKVVSGKTASGYNKASDQCYSLLLTSPATPTTLR